MWILTFSSLSLTVRLPVWNSVSVSLCLSLTVYLFIFVSVYLYVCISLSISVFLSIYYSLPAFSVCRFLPACLPACMPACLPACLFIWNDFIVTDLLNFDQDIKSLTMARHCWRIIAVVVFTLVLVTFSLSRALLTVQRASYKSYKIKT